MPIPTEVADEETLVRCLCSPFHCKNGKLLWNAFQPPRASDEVSVIRSAYLPPSACKAKGKQLTDPNSIPPKVYTGLTVIAAGAVRFCGARVVDSRIIYDGHADIRHGLKSEDNEPPAPHVVEAIREQCKRLLPYAKFIADPAPDAEDWTGAELIMTLAVP